VKRTDRGRAAEDLALAYLEARGLVPLARNYRSRRGEIDLIMRDGEITVFVEVRARSSNTFMTAVETIDNRKKKKIIFASQQYLQQSSERDDGYYRYDVVSIDGPVESGNIQWIKNAFDA